ncbi:MAG: 30S ribosomal protein S12 methylthiotransferase RimO [Treponema sp.]|jgi:ribosomal protein S12 methylthiotransferase|nr:30S ribosomal protein S12 methylthiotransferase RimO [Treponema sp.]
MNYFIDPFGCAKNQVDAEVMMARLNDAGWTACDDPDQADLIIVNSCGFIEAAKQESINAVLAWRRRYRGSGAPAKKILLSGCLAQRYRKELAESLPEADGFLGCTEIHQAPEKIAALFGAETGAAGIGAASAANTGSAGFRPGKQTNDIVGLRPGHETSYFGFRPLLGFPGSAYVKISEGCNNRCSFCAIPLIRGPLRCRTVRDIVEECRALLNRGVRELCLVGQDLASFLPPGDTGETAEPGAERRTGLGRLLTEITRLPGDFWVRSLYLHPDHFPLDILEIIKRDGRILPYFDIPFQHASPEILAAMNRRGGGDAYLRLLDAIRSRLPDAVIRSTFLTGFPGETESDFARLLDFQEKARFDWLGVFTYSREDNTPAYSMKNRTPKKTAGARKARLEERQIPITEERINRFVGRELEALLEEEVPAPGSKDAPAGPGLWLGRLYCQAPEVDGAAVVHAAGSLRPGTMVRGTVFARTGFDLQIRV